ncbi:MAG: NACHT domain-containing protein, partial [Chloroflexales bacterium]
MSISTPPTFGSLLREARERATNPQTGRPKLSQDALATLIGERLGTSSPTQQAVGAWERDEYRPDARERTTLLAIISILVVTGGLADKDTADTLLTVGGYAPLTETEWQAIRVWMWNRFGKDVPAWLSKQLDQDTKLTIDDREQQKAANQQQWSQVDWIQAAESYRQKMLELHGSMQIFGMNRPVPLANVFTDVYLLDKPSAWHRHTIDELKSRSLMHADPANADQRREGGALVANQKRIFILGQPGTGKTTFLKHLVMQAVQQQLDAIPIFVSLKVWSDSKLDLMAFLVHQFAICHFPHAQPFIETILTEGRAIILFDGLDEVNYEGGHHERTTQAIREFAQQYGKSRIVITCRTAATEYTFEQFTYCEVADFIQTEIETFVGHWFQQDEVKREGFLTAFARPEHERLRDLARRPLLLTMLCLTFDETMTFPQRRAELYEEAIDALLKKWDNARSIQRDVVYRKLSLGHKRQLLTEVAAETFERSEFFMPKRDLTTRVVRFLRRLPPPDQGEDIDGEAVLRSIEAQHGLLIERAHDIYSFSHLTFHEYFTARYIANRQDVQSLRGALAQADNPQWREVLLLTASMLDYDSSALLFQLWSHTLQVQLYDNPLLAQLLEWTAEQARRIGPTNLGLRAAILSTTMIDQAIQHNRKLITLLKGVKSDARAHARTHALARARARASDLAHASARATAL